MHVHSILLEDFVYTKLPRSWILFVTSQVNILGAFLVTCEHVQDMHYCGLSDTWFPTEVKLGSEHSAFLGQPS